MSSKYIFIAVVAAITGCSTSSGVLKMGADTFSVYAHAAPIRGGLATAKQTAYVEANKECNGAGKEMLVLSERIDRQGTSLTLVFKCLKSGDPELAKSPEFINHPDITIEEQKK
jgi:hypothetical protein